MRNQLMILQAYGAGDCIFAQGVAKKFINDGYEVVWPVKPWFVDGLQRAYPHVTWVTDTIVKPELFDIKEDKIVDGVRIFPMRWSDRIMGQPAKYWMKTKFMLAGLDYNTWKKDAMFKRDKKRESALFYEVHWIKGHERYNLVNKNFRSDASKQLDISVKNENKNVEMEILDGFSLFDYAMIIERAETIHVANSAIFYLLELLNLSAKEIHLYSRVPDEVGFPYVDYLMTKPYILH